MNSTTQKSDVKSSFLLIPISNDRPATLFSFKSFCLRRHVQNDPQEVDRIPPIPDRFSLMSNILLKFYRSIPLSKIVALLFFSLSTAAWGQESSVTQISREDKLLQQIHSGSEDFYIKSQRIEMASGVMAPVHLHPVPTFGVINHGEIVFQIKGQDAIILREGDTFFEPSNVSILKFGNKGSFRAAFTVFYLMKDKKSTTTVIK